MPRKVHHVWLGGAPSAECARSSASWRAFAKAHRFEYTLWREADLARLPMRNRALYEDTAHAIQMRADVARYEVLYHKGGLYVDCDLQWLGERVARPAAHAPTLAFVKLLEHASFAATPHYMRDAWERPHWDANLARPTLTTVFFNVAVMATVPHNPFLKKLIGHLPEHSRRTLDAGIEHAYLQTGPEPLTRAVMIRCERSSRGGTTQIAPSARRTSR